MQLDVPFMNQTCGISTTYAREKLIVHATNFKKLFTRMSRLEGAINPQTRADIRTLWVFSAFSARKSRSYASL
jgi:hypothetical protein